MNRQIQNLFLHFLTQNFNIQKTWNVVHLNGQLLWYFKKMLTKNSLLYVVLEQLIDIIQVKNICNQWINLNLLGYISKIELC